MKNVNPDKSSFIDPTQITSEERILIAKAQRPEDLPEKLQQEWVNIEMAQSDAKKNP